MDCFSVFTLTSGCKQTINALKIWLQCVFQSCDFLSGFFCIKSNFIQVRKNFKNTFDRTSCCVSTAISPFNEVVLVPSFLMKRWINYVMFSSLWLIADNDVWEVCQTGEHTGLPSGAGPRSGCVHLTNEMSRREDGATKRSLQTNSPQHWTAQTASNSVGSLHGLPTDHNPLEVHFQGCWP